MHPNTPRTPHTPASDPSPVPRRIDQLLDSYAESHQHPTNKLIHWVCVPAITWCVLVGFYLLPYPEAMGQASGMNWMWIFLAFSLTYYMRLSKPLTMGFLVAVTACVALIGGYEALYAHTQTLSLGSFAALVFVLAWIGQFIGHRIEGKKPSFLQDLQFLLIGPAWLLHFIYKKWGIRY